MTKAIVKMGRPEGLEVEFNNIQEQVLYGTLLGDASVSNHHKRCGNSVVSIEHTTKQQGYALWKAGILGMNITTRDRLDPRTDKTYHSIIATSTASPTYSHIYNRMYGTGGFKELDQEMLWTLNEVGLTTLFLDDGHTRYEGRRCILHTEKYNFRENTIIKEYFEERWGLSPKIQEKKSTGGIKYILAFTVVDSYKLLNIIRPYVPTPDMMYKTVVKPYLFEPKWLTTLKEQEKRDSMDKSQESQRLIA